MCHIHVGFVDEANAFFLEEFNLTVGAPKRKSFGDTSVLLHHAVAGDDAGFRVDVERIAHNPGEAFVADGFRDLAVGGNGAARDLLYGLVDLIERRHVRSLRNAGDDGAIQPGNGGNPHVVVLAGFL